MVEKLGHSKRIQLYRKQWIDEGKPNHSSEFPTNIDIVNDNNELRSLDDEKAFDRLFSAAENSAAADEGAEVLSEPVAHAERESSVPPADELDMLLNENS